MTALVVGLMACGSPPASRPAAPASPAAASTSPGDGAARTPDAASSEPDASDEAGHDADMPRVAAERDAFMAARYAALPACGAASGRALVVSRSARRVAAEGAIRQVDAADDRRPDCSRVCCGWAAGDLALDVAGSEVTLADIGVCDALCAPTACVPLAPAGQAAAWRLRVSGDYVATGDDYGPRVLHVTDVCRL